MTDIIEETLAEHRRGARLGQCTCGAQFTAFEDHQAGAVRGALTSDEAVVRVGFAISLFVAPGLSRADAARAGINALIGGDEE